MKAKTVIALALATAFGVSMSGAYADYDHRDGRDFRNEHRDGREFRRDYAPIGYVAARPVYVAPPIAFSPLPWFASLNITLPIHFH